MRRIIALMDQLSGPLRNYPEKEQDLLVKRVYDTMWTIISNLWRAPSSSSKRDFHNLIKSAVDGCYLLQVKFQVSYSFEYIKQRFFHDVSNQISTVITELEDVLKSASSS